MIGTSRSYLHDSHFALVNSSYFLHIPSYYLLHISSEFGPERGADGGQISRGGGIVSFIYTPGVELRIFPSPTETHDWSDTHLHDSHLTSLNFREAGARKFHSYPRGRARSFPKSHGVLLLVGIFYVGL